MFQRRPFDEDVEGPSPFDYEVYTDQAAVRSVHFQKRSFLRVFRRNKPIAKGLRKFYRLDREAHVLLLRLAHGRDLAVEPSRPIPQVLILGRVQRRVDLVVHPQLQELAALTVNQRPLPLHFGELIPHGGLTILRQRSQRAEEPPPHAIILDFEPPELLKW